MNTNNWRPSEGGSGYVGDFSMESSDWRDQLQAGSRERMVNRILDSMKSHIQVSGNEGLQELEKIAASFEEKVYIAAISESDYTRKICFKILTIETRSQNPMPDAYSVNNSYPALLDSTNGEDWREEVYEKINAMKNLYLLDLNYMHQKLLHKLQQQLNNERIEKMKVIKNMLERFIAFLQIPKQNILHTYKDKLTTYEKQIVHIITSNLRRPGPTQQLQQHTGGGQSSASGGQQQRPMQEASSTSLDLTAQTGHPNDGDWQEEVYQKIKAMRDLYLLDLNNMHQKILCKLQQHESFPQQPKNEQLEKLKVFKNMLERFMAFLQIPKQSILAIYKDKLSTYEKQIVHVITSNRRKPVPTQQQQQQQQPQQQLPPPHMQSQSQQTHSQMAHENPMSSQMQTVNNLQQSSGTLLPTQVQQQSQQPQLQQQVMPHMQTQSGQVGMQQQQQTNMMQQRIPNAGGFQQQNVIDQQKQLFQQQRPMQETSSTSVDSTAQTGNPNGGDWQEEVYQKIKAMKDLYLLDLNDMHQKILGKLQQHDSLPQQPKNEQLEKLKVFKNMLERFMAFLQIPKHNILANYKDKLTTYEKQIVHIITSNRRKPAPTQQQPHPQ